jgi:nucleoside-specific outer membrane channel protein Tsx
LIAGGWLTVIDHGRLRTAWHFWGTSDMKDLLSKLALAGMVGALGISGTALGADLGSGGGGYKDAPAPAPAYFTDDVISYRYGTEFREPGNTKDIEKSIMNLQHVNTDKWGSNFFDIDFLFSAKNDPVNGNASQGATEVYGVFRRYWSYSGITETKFNNGIISDVGLRMGADFNTKNDTFSSEKKLLVVGPQVYFAVPIGFWFVSANYSHEWNHNGLVGMPFCGGICKGNANVDFDPAFEIESAWLFPFSVGDSDFKFKGFFNYVAPKGKDGLGNQTKGEILTRPELLLDVGNYWGQKNKLEVGVGYEYWLNKFGNDHDKVPGALANTPELVVRYHF